MTATSANIERKTDLSNEVGELEEITVTAKRSTDEKYKQGLINVLGKYRSYSYIITLAALDRSQFKDPSSYRESSTLNNIVLKSSGKSRGEDAESFFFTDPERSEKLRSQNTSTVILAEQAGKELETFNKISPGRFDLYINNLRIAVVPVANGNAGNTIATNFSFDVYEPYSVAGFLEALRAAALTTGFVNYLDATFIMKVEFIGYPDGEDLTNAEPIERSTRYFPIKFMKVDIDVNQSGSTYKCTAVSSDSFAFIDIVGQLKFPLKLSGKTVKDLLSNMVEKINENLLEERKKNDPNAKKEDVDEYAVEFLEFENNKFVVKDNDIAKSDFRGQSDSAEYSFENLNDTTKQTAYQQEGNPTTPVPYEPDKFAVAFNQSTNIHGVISAVIRDSQYWIDQSDPAKRKENSDNPNFFNFWKIISRVEYTEKYSTVYRRNIAKITYQVLKDKQHISRLQGFQADVYDSADINVIREYNYIYSGQNTEITNLKIEFDKMFYERVPLAIGVNNRDPSAISSQRNDYRNIETTSTGDVEAAKTQPAGSAPVAEMATPTQSVEPNAGKPLQTFNYALARQNYDNLLTSTNLSMIKLNLEILGDPIFLVTGGLGNYLPEFNSNELGSTLLTEDGEADFLTQQPLIKIIFNHPDDIDERTFDEGGTGLLKFSNPNIKFSGIYGIKKVESHFNNGVFKQKLELFRFPFTIDATDYQTPEADTANRYKTVPNPEDQRSDDAGKNKVVPQDKRSSIRDLISGVNRFADSIQNAEVRIAGAVQGAIGEVTGAISQVAQVPATFIGNITNRIQGKLQQIDDIAVDAANKLGLNSTQLSSLSPKELLAAVALSKLLPDNVNMAQLEENGIVVSNKDALKKLPAIEPIIPEEQLYKDPQVIADEIEEEIKKNFEIILQEEETEIKRTNLFG